MKGLVFNIQKFSINDGPGIRTTVFLKGCMLNCLWCHNPESKSARPQLMFHEKQCIGCGECVKACPLGLHRFVERELQVAERELQVGEEEFASNREVISDGEHSGQYIHVIDRERCIACGRCADACVGALEIVGKEMTVEEVLKEVMKDKIFYDNSGGGMTISGGEPLMQPVFTLELLKAAKAQGLHTCIETCGYAQWEDVEALLPYVDLFLWDVKESDTVRHKEYTGVNNERIFENIRRLNALGAQIVLRCPIIPGYNDREEHLQAIGALAEELTGVQRVDVEPYHPLGKSKSEGIGKEYALKDLSFPKEEEVKEWIHVIARQTRKPVGKA